MAECRACPTASFSRRESLKLPWPQSWPTTKIAHMMVPWASQ
jgi:hypothetical protein